MPLTVPPELKKITPFIRRAEELDKDKSSPESRLVAYYCRQYAVHTGIPLATSPEAQDCLGTILNALETEKKPMSAFTREESKYLCRQFADRIFTKADAEDRAGAASKGTAKTFYAAASFFEILSQFYADNDESEEREEEKKKTIYAKWKATDILKAMKEGRQPTPGGYGEKEEEEEEKEDEDEEENEHESGEVASEEPAPLVPTPLAPPEEEDDLVTTGKTKPTEEQTEDIFPTVPSVEPLKPPPIEDVPSEEPEAGTEVELGPPPAYPGQPSVAEQATGEVFIPELPMPPPPTNRPPVPVYKPPSPAKKKSGFFGMGSKKVKPGKVSKEAFTDALELSKFAVAALEAKDADLAASRLKQALDVLGK